ACPLKLAHLAKVDPPCGRVWATTGCVARVWAPQTQTYAQKETRPHEGTGWYRGQSTRAPAGTQRGPHTSYRAVETERRDGLITILEDGDSRPRDRAVDDS